MGFGFHPLKQMHKGEWSCRSTGRGAQLLAGCPIAITEDMFQWITNKKLPPRLRLIFHCSRKSSLFIFTLPKCFLLISGRTNPEASAGLLLKTAHCAVVGDLSTDYEAVRKAKPEWRGIKESGTLLGAPYSKDPADCMQKVA